MTAAAVGAAATEHRPALDGIRGVAVVLVVMAHTKMTPLVGGGQTGLVLFFALSGYLITTNLLRERGRSGKVRLGRFYVRRARRLYPALFVMVATVTALGWISAGDALWSVTYLGNWVRALGVTNLGSVGHTWSLAVEEQFYLVMPLLVASVAVRRLRVVLIVAAVGVMVWRPVLWLVTGDAVRVEFGFDTRADAIVLGCLLATMLTRPSRWLVTLAAVVLGVLSLTEVATFTVSLTLSALAAVVLVAHAATSHGPLEHPVMAWLGTRSYGIYLWHAPLLWRADELGVRDGKLTLVLLALTGLLAEGSYRFVEQRFRLHGTHVHPDPELRGTVRVFADLEADQVRRVSGVRGA